MKPYLYLFITTLLWGGVAVTTKIVSAYEAHALSACLRFFFAILVIAPHIFFKKEKRTLFFQTISKKENLILIFLMSLTGFFIYQIFYFKGFSLMTASKGSIIMGLSPIITTLAAWLFSGEKYTIFKMIGSIIAFIGAVFVISNGDFNTLLVSGMGHGELYLFGALLSWLICTLLAKKMVKDIAEETILLSNVLIGFFMLLVLSIFEGELNVLLEIKPSDWLSYFILGAGGVYGTLLYYKTIKLVGAGIASFSFNLVPLATVVISFFILNEALLPSVYLGGSFIVLGTILACKEV